MRPLRTPGFGLLVAGEVVNSVGNWVAIITIWGFASFRFDAGAGDIALLFVVLSLPGALLGPALGVPIDRLGPRRTLIIANALGIADALLLTQASSYGEVILLAMPLSLIEPLAAASLDALPPRLVEQDDLVSANALLTGAQDLAIVVGPLVAALVNARWGLGGAFLTDAATFAVGLGVALRIRVPPIPPDRENETTGSVWRETVAGLRLARSSPGLRWTLTVAALTYSLWALFGVLEPLYVRDVLHRSETVFAVLQAVFGAGLVSAGLALAVLGDRMAKPRYVAIATIASGALAALYLGTRSLPVAFVGVFLWGADVAFFSVPAKTLLQRYSPVAAHGRVMSLNQSLEPLAALVATPVAAVLVGLVGVRVLGVVGGALAAAGGLVALGLTRRLALPSRSAGESTETVEPAPPRPVANLRP